jgi:hypothetical protein
VLLAISRQPTSRSAGPFSLDEEIGQAPVEADPAGFAADLPDRVMLGDVSGHPVFAPMGGGGPGSEAGAAGFFDGLFAADFQVRRADRLGRGLAERRVA